MNNIFKKYKTLWIVSGVILIVIFVFSGQLNKEPGELDAFAGCLHEEGAKFYGTHWCPFCDDQKEMFGKSAKHLPYVECSTPTGQGVNPNCREAGVSSYPTWVFADGTKEVGKQPLSSLADKTSCDLPFDLEE